MRYVFDHWEDGSTNPVRDITVGSDMVLTAYYVEPAAVKRSVTVESTPIDVPINVNGVDYASGTVLEVDDGSNITVSVPSEVEK